MVKNPEIIRKESKDKRHGRITVTYCYKHDHTILHRDNGPAYIIKTKTGKVMTKMWYKHGLLHRDNGPALIQVYESYDNTWNCDMIYYQNGLEHRDDGPSTIRTFPDRMVHMYEKRGIRHSTQHPSRIDYYDDNTEIEYFIFGNFIEEDKFKQIQHELFMKKTPMGEILGTPIYDSCKRIGPYFIQKYFLNNL